MSGDDAPALRKADPGLHLPPDLPRRVVAPEQRGRDRAIPAVCDNARLLELSREALRRARRAERLDRLIAVEVLGSPIADDVLARREEAVERRDIVGDQRALIGRESGLDLGLRI